MRLSIEQHHLQQLLSRVIGAVGKRTTIPILGNVLLSATNTLQATTTDLDMQITAQADAQVTAPGETTVNATLLTGIVAKLPKGSLVNLDLKDEILHVQAGRSKFKLSTLPVEDFPVMASNEYKSRLEFQGLELQAALKKTVWAASTETTRYYLNGVAMQHRDGKANFIATDGHRLAWFTDGYVDEFPNVIIPNEAVKQFIGALDEGESVLEVSETKIRLTHNDTVIVTKTIGGTFPEWSRVLPANIPNKVTLPSVAAKEAIERVSIVASEKTKVVKLSVADSEIKFYVRDQVMGDATEVIEAQQDGDGVEIGLNGRYALDAFAQADKGEVTVHYGGGMDTVKVTYDKEEGLVVVVMPVRI